MSIIAKSKASPIWSRDAISILLIFAGFSRKYEGQTPLEADLCSCACTMLRSILQVRGTLVKNVAAELGFHDVFQFSRTFRPHLWRVAAPVSRMYIDHGRLHTIFVLPTGPSRREKH